MNVMTGDCQVSMKNIDMELLILCGCSEQHITRCEEIEDN